jgi:hypothetical protein
LPLVMLPPQQGPTTPWTTTSSTNGLCI